MKENQGSVKLVQIQTIYYLVYFDHLYNLVSLKQISLKEARKFNAIVFNTDGYMDVEQPPHMTQVLESAVNYI